MFGGILANGEEDFRGPVIPRRATLAIEGQSGGLGAGEE